jgi:hypothetical protein
MAKLSFFATAAALGVFLSGYSADAATLTFDDINAGQIAAQIPNGYGGVNWDNFYTLDAVNFDLNPSGYNNGLVSNNNVAYNGFANPASISAISSPFSLVSGYFTGAWNNGLTIDVVGQVAGVNTYFTSFVVDSAKPTLETFNWSNLSSVTFSSSGGASAGFAGGGEHFALDNLTLNGVASAVPEPSTWVMMFIGLGVVGAAMRSRKALTGQGANLVAA